jgi:hypothetical protein
VAWLFGTAAGGGTAAGAGAGAGAGVAAGAGTAGGIGAGLTTIGGTGTFGGLGVGGSGAALSGVGSGASLLGGAAPAYGAGTLAAALGGTSPSLLTGAGSFTGGAAGSLQSSLMSNQLFQPNAVQRVQQAGAQLVPGGQDILDGLLTGLTLSGAPAGTAGGGERGVAPQSLPGQVSAMPSQANRGRMGFNTNGILSWLPQTPQTPQVPTIPGQMPQPGMYRG